MGEIIGAHAAAEDIASDVKQTLETALARGGEIAAAANARLASSAAAIAQAETIRKSAHDAELAAWAPVDAADHTADKAIMVVHDAMYNALGRPRSSPDMDRVFPEGARTYTAGNPRDQPLLMQVLTTRIQSASAPQWTDAEKQAWVASIDASRAALATAVDQHRPADAAVTIADAAFRASARTGHARLTAFKRDLKNLGLSEAQIHLIIPDRPRSKAKPHEEPAPAPVPAAPPLTPPNP